MASSSASQRLVGKSTQGGPPRFRTFLHNTICDVLLHRGWRETDSETEWDFFWADVHWMREHFDHIHLDEGQRVNHFRNHFEMTRKDLLCKNLKRIRKQLQREDKRDEAERFAFSPTTYNVPSEYTLFVEEFKRQPGSVWIMKPIGRAQGKGIFLFNRLNQISEWKRDYRWRTEGQQAENYVVQRYVENPYLVGGKKFDLRLYLLVTSYSPLTAYLFRGGFARFSFHRFSMEENEIDNSYIHLTNVAIQKGGEKYDKDKGCKWNLRNLKLYMVSKHGLETVNQLFEDIKDMLIRTLLSVQKIMINDKHCFELYGFDILIDDALKPWLLEVNASPSLSAETQDDYDRKFSMLEDVVNIVELEKKNGGPAQEHVGGFDMIMKQGNAVLAEKNSLQLRDEERNATRGLSKKDGKRKKETKKEFKQREEALKEEHRLQLLSLREEGDEEDERVEEAEEDRGEKSLEKSIVEAFAPSRPEKKKKGKMSRSQRRKMERLEKEREEARLFQERLSQRVDKGELETERLRAQIRPLGLGVRQVAPDGHCMFSAVSLALAGAEDRNSLRTKVADCLRSHAERFRPFMLTEEGDVLDEERFLEHCQKIASTAEWGGAAELQACAQVLRRPVYVFQAGLMQGDPEKDSNPIRAACAFVVGDEFEGEGEPVLLSYHRQMYSTGEHYNAVVPQAQGVHADGQ